MFSNPSNKLCKQAETTRQTYVRSTIFRSMKNIYIRQNYRPSWGVMSNDPVCDIQFLFGGKSPPPKPVDVAKIYRKEAQRRRKDIVGIKHDRIYLLIGGTGLSMAYTGYFQKLNISSRILLGNIHLLESVYLLDGGSLSEEKIAEHTYEYELLDLIIRHGDVSCVAFGSDSVRERFFELYRIQCK